MKLSCQNILLFSVVAVVITLITTLAALLPVLLCSSHSVLYWQGQGSPGLD